MQGLEHLPDLRCTKAFAMSGELVVRM
jgi:hypothetical protein